MSDLETDLSGIAEDELPATLPVLPLKETVVFPESMTPLAIGQERSIRLSSSRGCAASGSSAAFSTSRT